MAGLKFYTISITNGFTIALNTSDLQLGDYAANISIEDADIKVNSNGMLYGKINCVLYVNNLQQDCSIYNFYAEFVGEELNFIDYYDSKLTAELHEEFMHVFKSLRLLFN